MVYRRQVTSQAVEIVIQQHQRRNADQEVSTGLQHVDKVGDRVSVVFDVLENVDVEHGVHALRKQRSQLLAHQDVADGKVSTEHRRFGVLDAVAIVIQSPVITELAEHLAVMPVPKPDLDDLSLQIRLELINYPVHVILRVGDRARIGVGAGFETVEAIPLAER